LEIVLDHEFLKQTAMISAAAAAARMADGAAALPKGELPKISLGGLKVSRPILGSNPFFGFDHSNPRASGHEMRE
jgi:hypothetical protein